MSATPSRSRSLGTLDLVLVTAFVVALFVPSAVMLAVDDPAPLRAGEALAPAPTRPTTLQAWVTLPLRVKDHFRDHFGLRRTLIGWNARLHASLLGISSSPDVTVGRDGWLYLASEGSVDDYRALKPYAPGELERLGDVIEQWRAFLHRRDIPFLVVICPNKQTIYPEHLPAWMTRVGEATRLDRFVAHLRERRGIEVVDLRPALLEAKRLGYPLFFRTDTHWNALGGFVGYREIAKRLARSFPAVTVPELAEVRVSVDRGPAGELARMIGTVDLPDEAVTVTQPAPPTARVVVGGEQRLQNMPITPQVVTERPGAPIRRAVIFRDSFATALIGYLGELFEHADYRWTRIFDFDLVERERPDVVVFQVVERGLMGWDLTVQPPSTERHGPSALR